MPVVKRSNGKWAIGSGKGIYKTKEVADRAYKGYLAKKHMTKSEKLIAVIENSTNENMVKQFEEAVYDIVISTYGTDTANAMRDTIGDWISQDNKLPTRKEVYDLALEHLPGREAKMLTDKIMDYFKKYTVKSEKKTDWDIKQTEDGTWVLKDKNDYYYRNKDGYVMVFQNKDDALDFYNSLNEAEGMKINDYQIVDHGPDASDYFSGISTNNYKAKYVGIGDSYKTALEDAMDQAAQDGWIIPQRLEDEAMNADSSDQITGKYDNDEENPDSDGTNNWYYYVGLRVK